MNQNDMDVTAAIVNLLNNMGMDSAGMEKLKGGNRDIVPLLADIMKMHRGRVKICEPALQLMAKLAQPGSTPTSSHFKVNMMFYSTQSFQISFNLQLLYSQEMQSKLQIGLRGRVQQLRDTWMLI